MRRTIEWERAHPPDPDTSDPQEALHAAVADALRGDADLTSTMNAILRSSLDVQDVSITDTSGVILVSTNPDDINQRAPTRAACA